MIDKFNLLYLFSIILLLNFIGKINAADDGTDDWLHVNDNNEIVDENGNPVWLTGTNWFGFNTGTGVFDGLWQGNMRKIFEQLADRGFNFLRIPVSVEILLEFKNGGGGRTPQVNIIANPELENEGKTSFDLWTLALKWCKELGIKVMVDVHCGKSDPNGHVVNLWYTGGYTTEDWIKALTWVAEYYKNDDTILALDLKNEPHGKGDDIIKGNGAKWDGTTDPNNWKYAAETCALAVLEKNPKLLIMIEGIEVYPKEGFDWTYPTHDYMKDEDYYYPGWWGGNFRGVKEFPIDLGKYQSQLVYSPHDYGPLVWQQTWFHDGFTSESIMEEYWHDSWFFILEEKISPLLIGEWGGYLDGGKNEKWMELIRDLMIENHIHHTFWCLNANSGDTGGLLDYDFATWNEDKYELVKPSLWHTDDGKFIGLDHKVPLGKNGLSLDDYYKK